MNEINKYGFLNALISIINTYDEDDSKVVIAKYLLKNFDHVQQLNIYEVADECFVTRASIRRFAQHIGFENFRDLKANPELYSYYQRLEKIADYPTFLANQIAQMALDCNACINQELDRIIAYLDSCEQIVFLVDDVYSSRCVEFQKAMILSGKMVRIISHKFTDNKLLKNLTEKDLLIMISVTGGSAQRMDHFIQKIQCKKILFTVMHQQLFDAHYDFVLHLGSKNLPQIKTIYHMFAVEYCLDLIFHAYRKTKLHR